MNRLFNILLLIFVAINISGQTTPSDNIHGGSSNGIVGKVSDEYDVTPNGQFHYNVPLTVVSGTGGMSPKLSITFNSSNGRGLLGYGFDLTGLSMICRAPQNLYRDGKADVIRFTSSDRFTLDGVRLSLFQKTSTGAEYRTETNSFSKIISEGDSVNPTKFTVYTKDGLIREFTSARTLMGSSGNNIYWLETKVSDTKGNYYTVTYSGNASTNEYYPIRIDYTGNTGASLSPYASVRFTYQNASTTSTSYISGVKVCRSKIIKTVGCYYGNQLIRKYEISYASIRGKQFISQICEQAGNEKKNPTVFSWNNNGSISVSNSVASTDAAFKNKYIVTGDFNGDGKTDFIARANNNKKDKSYQIYISNGSSFNTPINGLFVMPSVRPNLESFNEIKTGDFNGDGYDDLVVERANSPFYAIDLYLTHVDTSGNISIVYEKTIIPAIQMEHTIKVMDTNCDGVADLFIHNANVGSTSYFVLLSQSTETSIIPLAQQYSGDISGDSWANLLGSVLLVDLDGDGTSEILNVQEKNYSSLYTIKTSGELQREKFLSLSGDDYFTIGDFNGDGKTDVLTMGTKSNADAAWEINFSTGLISGQNFESCSVLNLFQAKDKTVYVADINGDGYDDLYVTNKTTSNNQKKPIDIYINDGTGKTFDHYTGANVYGSDKRVFKFGDFTGNGKTDFVCYAKVKDATVGYDLYTVSNNDNNLLNSITDGLGNHTEIEYKRLTDTTVHTRGSMTTYPLISISCPWSVVSRISAPDGIGGRHNVDYHYKNLILHKHGRGVLGFEQVTESDLILGTKTTKEYEVLRSEMLPILKSVKTFSGNKLSSESFYTNSLAYQLHNGKKEVAFTCYPTHVVEHAYEYNSGAMTSDIETENAYDGYGNVTRIETRNGNNITTTVNTYSNDESRWILGRLTKAEVTKEGNNGDNITLTSEFEYDSTSGLLLKESFEPESSNGYQKTYTYDKYGNILEDVLTPNDGDYDERTTRTQYTADGRFKIRTENSLGFVTTSQIDSSWGTETQSTDINGQTSSYQYNSFGELTQAVSPLTTTHVTRAWSNGHEYAPSNAVYYIKTETTGTPVQWEFFDALDRTVRKASVGRNGKIIYSDAIYNNKGQVIKTSEPYFRGETAQWNMMEYDVVGRVVKETRANGAASSFSYNGLTVSTTDPLNHTSSKTYDLNGHLITSTDALGNSVTFKYDVNGKCTETAGPRTTIRVEYDKLGNRTKLEDPDLGTIEYEYNSFGELTSQTDSYGETTFEYDQGGRLLQECRPDFTYTHTYDTEWKGALSSSSCSNGTSHTYSYDGYGRVTGEQEVINGETFSTSYTYNNINKVDVITYPSGFQVKNNYTANGYLQSVTSNDSNHKAYWTAGAVNARGQLESEELGNGVTVTNQYNLMGAMASTSAPNLFNKTFTYDLKNNLLSRTDEIRSLTENFEYDALDRLVKVSSNATQEQVINYDEAGNIIYKTGVGNISYEEGTNRISEISHGLPVWDNIKYTSFNKITSVTRDHSNKVYVINTNLYLLYGPDKCRKLQRIYKFQRRRFCGRPHGNFTKDLETKYYVGNLYEKIVTDADIREINYIFADGKTVALFETSEENDDRTLYLHHDHLGSVMAFSNENGQIEEELSYDAWGRRRSPSTWEPLAFSDDDTSDYDQGFTGHEHIDLFDMVNMDGRMYDPVVGRFLSPDPYIQMPDFTQSLNRYAYCINNPLSLTDPTGYNWFGDFFAVAVGIAVGIETGGLGAGIYGAIIGGTLGGASAALVGSVLNGANLWQTTKNVFVGAFWGAAGGAMNFEIGELRNVFARIAVHSVSEGFVEGIQGGHFEHGLLMGLTSSTGGELISRYGSNLPYAGQIAANATLGGLVSELGGGKFANGAMTAAYTMMYNELMHPSVKRVLKNILKKGASYNRIMALKYAIQADGILSFEEAYIWYQLGNGKEITVDASKLCLPTIKKDGIPWEKVNEYGNFSINTYQGGADQFLVYGTITGHVESSNRISIITDTYNFEMHSLKGGPMNIIKEIIRNGETAIGGWLHGHGTTFNINFKGYYKF